MTNKYMYFIANWKMFGSLNSLKSLDKFIKFFKNFKKNTYSKIIYCPPTILINPMIKKLKKTRIQIVAQNFHENQKSDMPISLYAATKKSNEILAHSYSHLFSIPTTIFRFFLSEFSNFSLS